MTGSAKQKTLILLGWVVIITVILSASLSQLELGPGLPLPSLDNGQVVIAPEEQEQAVLLPISEVSRPSCRRSVPTSDRRRRRSSALGIRLPSPRP